MLSHQLALKLINAERQLVKNQKIENNQSFTCEISVLVMTVKGELSSPDKWALGDR